MGLRTWFRFAWDRVFALAAIAAGAIALLVGWIGVSGESDPSRQLPYVISGGIFGVFALGLGVLFWLSGNLRDEWTELRGIHRALDRIADPALIDAEAEIRRLAPEPTVHLSSRASAARVEAR